MGIICQQKVENNMKEGKKELIVMLGGQGSGKGTLSKKLMEERNYNYVETGAMLRALPENHPLNAIISRGEFVPDEDVYNLLKEKINPAQDTILDGFPRQLSQAKWLVENFADKFNMVVVYLNLSRELMEKRIQNRIAQGGGRADDADTVAVERRLNAFFDKTMPTIEWLSALPNITFLDIPIQDAPIEVNYQTMRNALINAKM